MRLKKSSVTFDSSNISSNRKIFVSPVQASHHIPCIIYLNVNLKSKYKIILNQSKATDAFFFFLFF